LAPPSDDFNRLLAAFNEAEPAAAPTPTATLSDDFSRLRAAANADSVSLVALIVLVMLPKEAAGLGAAGLAGGKTALPPPAEEAEVLRGKS